MTLELEAVFHVPAIRVRSHVAVDSQWAGSSSGAGRRRGRLVASRPHVAGHLSFFFKFQGKKSENYQTNINTTHSQSMHKLLRGRQLA